MKLAVIASAFSLCFCSFSVDDVLHYG